MTIESLNEFPRIAQLLSNLLESESNLNTELALHY